MVSMAVGTAVWPGPPFSAVLWVATRVRPLQVARPTAATFPGAGTAFLHLLHQALPFPPLQGPLPRSLGHAAAVRRVSALPGQVAEITAQTHGAAGKGSVRPCAGGRGRPCPALLRGRPAGSGGAALPAAAQPGEPPGGVWAPGQFFCGLWSEMAVCSKTVPGGISMEFSREEGQNSSSQFLSPAGRGLAPGFPAALGDRGGSSFPFHSHQPLPAMPSAVPQEGC